jgi:hypothetical protein
MNEFPLTAAQLDVATSWLVRNGSVLFYGTPATIDDTLVDDLIHVANGRRVLRHRGGQADPDRPLGALIGLFSSVDESEAAALLPEQRQVLAESIFRPASPAAGGPAGAPRGPTGQSHLHSLSRSTPLLLVLDAVHRLDRESRRALQFVAQKANDLPVVVLAVEDVPASRTPEGYRLCPSPLVMIRLSPVCHPSLS